MVLAGFNAKAQRRKGKKFPVCRIYFKDERHAALFSLAGTVRCDVPARAAAGGNGFAQDEDGLASSLRRCYAARTAQRTVPTFKSPAAWRPGGKKPAARIFSVHREDNFGLRRDRRQNQKSAGRFRQ
jgi:hypothetical protein